MTDTINPDAFDHLPVIHLPPVEAENLSNPLPDLGADGRAEATRSVDHAGMVLDVRSSTLRYYRPFADNNAAYEPDVEKAAVKTMMASGLLREPLNPDDLDDASDELETVMSAIERIARDDFGGDLDGPPAMTPDGKPFADELSVRFGALISAAKLTAASIDLRGRAGLLRSFVDFDEDTSTADVANTIHVLSRGQVREAPVSSIEGLLPALLVPLAYAWMSITDEPGDELQFDPSAARGEDSGHALGFTMFGLTALAVAGWTFTDQEIAAAFPEMRQHFHNHELWGVDA